MMTESLLNQIVNVLRAKPDSKASSIAKALGVKRGEVNSVLYKNPRLFDSVGTDPPVWRVTSEDKKPLSTPIRTSSPKRVRDVMKVTGIEEQRIFQESAITKAIELDEVLSLEYGDLEIEIDLMERGVGDCYVTYEMESAQKMNLIVNLNSLSDTALNNPYNLFQHILHCAADAIILKAAAQAAGSMDRDDVFALKSSILFEMSRRKAI